MKTLRFLLSTCIAMAFLTSCSVEPTVNENETVANDQTRTGLSFNELFTFTSEGQHFLGLGMTISKTENAIYIAHRQNVSSSKDERILKYNIESTEISEYNFDHTDLVSKELEVINNAVYLVGGSVINRYRTTMEHEPKSVPHERNLYRYGATSSYEDLYIIGGGNTLVESENGGDSVEANQILKYNTIREKFETETVMPARKFFADASIVDNKMYIFGGSESMDHLGTDDIYIYDMATGVINTSYKMPTNVIHTFTSSIDNLIVVGGSRWLDVNEADASFDDVDHFESFLGLFDTTTNQFTELALPFDDANKNAIQQVGVNGDYLYVVYGDTESQADGLKHYSVQAANISSIR